MKNFITSTLFAIGMLISCGEKPSGGHVEHGTNTDTATDAQSGQAAETVTLELDNGRKWKTNREMLPFIREQEQLLKAYDKEKDDYKVLAAGLHDASQSLIKSCTMTGKSHEVLHVWLTGHLNSIDLLARAATKEEKEKATAELRHSMETYHQYFD